MFFPFLFSVPQITTYSQPWGSIEPRYVFHGSIFTFATMIGFSLIFLPSSFAQAAVWDRAVCNDTIELLALHSQNIG